MFSQNLYTQGSSLLRASKLTILKENVSPYKVQTFFEKFDLINKWISQIVNYTKC